ncbi:uncharacterized protein LOC123012471 [Tribolium madens]|uniref:uncharacterized protein LOC123012471 n=1 Tax=Tribolium madens TaxID=41895 RepID=UPI001CF72B27|nr:uncharacterized protein LOC123012471 [Tribolium madens]
MGVEKGQVYLRKTFLNYELTPRQDIIINYFIPSVCSFLLYIFLFASDCVVVFRHYKDEDPIWASVTLFIIYFPSLCSYIVVTSSWELWPEMEGCGCDNFLWWLIKTLEHLLFPVWAIWRFAERIFWSIEGMRSNDEKTISEAIQTITAPRSIELYFFFQAFLQSLPQMLLHINIIMRQVEDTHKQTTDAEILSFVFNLAKLAATVAFYHRFKTQKLAGKQYPWFKAYKKPKDPTIDQIDSPLKPAETKKNEDDPVIISESRRSSGSFMEPSTGSLKELPGTLRETSVIDGPLRKLYQETSEPDFNIKRVAVIKGLPEDDLAGKLVAFCWWLCFLLVRILAISAFFFFYPNATIWLLLAHFLLVVAFLVYDVKSDDVKRAKALFFVFIGLIYIFCIIEFKIKFKKTKFMYYGYFSLVYLQNFIMCMVWWVHNVEDMHNDFWFRYIFYIVVVGSIISVLSMVLYLNINKPKKIVVGEKILL